MVTNTDDIVHILTNESQQAHDMCRNFAGRVLESCTLECPPGVTPPQAPRMTRGGQTVGVTYSIVARDPATGHLGVGVASWT